MLASAVNAHEMTPTYPKLAPSSYEGIYKTTMNIIIMGGPGSGKGTICKKLVNDFNYKLISAGDLLREEKASGSELGKEIATLIDAGNLILRFPGAEAIQVLLLGVAVYRSGARRHRQIGGG